MKYLTTLVKILAPMSIYCNYVSSEVDVHSPHYISPFEVISSPRQSIEYIKDAVYTLKGARLIKEEPLSLTYEFTSTFFRFKDVVSFCYSQENNVIECNSRSLFGYYDFGVNRKRLERIRSLYTVKKH